MQCFVSGSASVLITHFDLVVPVLVLLIDQCWQCSATFFLCVLPPYLIYHYLKAVMQLIQEL